MDPEGKWSFDLQRGLDEKKREETQEERGFLCKRSYDKQTEGIWSYDDGNEQPHKKRHEQGLLFPCQGIETKGRNWSYGYQTEDKCSYNLQSVQAEKQREIEDAHQLHLHKKKRGETDEERGSFFEVPFVDKLRYLIEQESEERESESEREMRFFLKCHDGDKLWLRYSPSLHANSEQDNWSMYPSDDPYHVWTLDERVPKLYIWLGLDSIFCLHLNRLISYTEKPKLKMVFSLCNKHNIGTEYPPGGLFVMDSKLHYFGGGADKFNFNKKVSSFNLPSLKPDHSTYFPDNLDCKARPIVFTISNKVYTLATLPVSMDCESNLFEVFEPEVGEWRSLPAPPVPALCTLTSHGVFRNKILLQTFCGDFVFDANAEMKKWEITNAYPKFCAVLEHEDLLLVLTREPSFKLVAYELTSFGEIDCTPHVLHIKKKYFKFSKLNIIWASLNLVENNCICLVFISTCYIHVFSFEVIKTDDDIRAHVKAYHEIDIPIERSPDSLLYSTFLWSPPDVNEQNPTGTKLSQIYN